MGPSAARHLEVVRLDPGECLAVDHCRRFHVTVLSNFSRGYDRYRRLYRKALIPQSSYPREFYVLAEEDLEIGFAKARGLKTKLSIPNDELLVIEAHVPAYRLEPNRRNGLGAVWPSPDLPVARLFRVDAGGTLAPLSLEDAMAKSLSLHEAAFHAYEALTPRSVSLLPIARGCQAACPFCFSEASASADQRQRPVDWQAVAGWLSFARTRGAERAVITGGGEPTMLPFSSLTLMVRECRARLPKVVLITNGSALATMHESDAVACVHALQRAGLSVLAVSRHHHDETRNTALMRFETCTPKLLSAARRVSDQSSGLRLPLICVLQSGAVESVEDVDDYVRWASAAGADEVCFKELYVSTSAESVYHSRAANAWSASHQVPLSVVLAWAKRRGLVLQERLPWGAPVFVGEVDSRLIRVAAYTEPSLYWERTRGIARSWNVMADGSCLASLEDRRSRLAPVPVGLHAQGVAP